MNENEQKKRTTSSSIFKAYDLVSMEFKNGLARSNSHIAMQFNCFFVWYLKFSLISLFHWKTNKERIGSGGVGTTSFGAEVLFSQNAISGAFRLHLTHKDAW